MSEKRYVIKEIFPTIQGEGAYAGTPAVFVRFAGCNVWSGLERTRERDARRTGAQCPRWCDTDFFRGDHMPWDEVIGGILDAAWQGAATARLVVFTGGEPTLQLDEGLLAEVAFHCPGVTRAIETNGTNEVPWGLDWVCVSPKHPDRWVRQRIGDELKVVYPAYNPFDYRDLARGFHHWYVSPEATPLRPGQASRVVSDNMKGATAFVMENPGWKLSLQTHKIVGLP